MAERTVRLTKHSPAYWRVTFDMPPLNIFGPDTIPQLDEAITALETDEQVKVVVFDSAVDGFFITHYDFVAPLEDSARIPAGATGLQAASRHAGRGSSRAPGGVDRLDPRACHRRRQRARPRQRYAIRQPGEGAAVSVGGGRGPGARRRADGAAAAADRARAAPWKSC